MLLCMGPVQRNWSYLSTYKKFWQHMHSSCGSRLVIPSRERHIQLNLPDLSSKHLTMKCSSVTQMIEHLSINQKVLSSNTNWIKSFLDMSLSLHIFSVSIYYCKLMSSPHILLASCIWAISKRRKHMGKMC